MRNMDLNTFHFKKSFGQNFIREDSIVEKIKKVSDIPKNTLILEIGPGAGSLTKKLAQTQNQVLAYEIDTRLQHVLEEEFHDFDNVSFIFEDFMKRNVIQDISSYSYDYLYVIANLPYYITTPIIEKVIASLPVDKMVFMVQKEVAIRFSAQPGSKDYGSISVFLQSYFDVKIEFIVSRNCFYPKPNVDSAVISFTKKEVPFNIYNREKFEKLVRDSFQFKRKTLRNNLKGYNLEKLESVLQEYGHDLSDRAEIITLEEFVKMSHVL